MDHARRQIQKYEIDIQNYEQQQTKAQRVLQRLQTEYEAQIAVKIENKGLWFLYLVFIFKSLVERQREQTADSENYQKEVQLNVSQ